eukprot:2231957-Lingulodinium_polyedra.AAC.1
MQAHFRSVPTLLSIAKQEHVASNAVWTDALQLAYRNCLRAVRRGLGPARQQAPFPFARAHELP